MARRRAVLIALGLMLTLFMGGLACTHADSGAPAAQPPQNTCPVDVFCTREYRPAVCRYADQEFASSNTCEAKRLARNFACERKEVFDESKLVCEIKGETLTVADPCDQIKTEVCTRERQPSVCRFQGSTFSGANRCEALRSARLHACQNKRKFSEEDSKCEAVKSP